MAKNFNLTLMMLLALLITLVITIGYGCDDDDPKEKEIKDKFQGNYELEEMITIAAGPLSGIYYPIGIGVSDAIEKSLDYDISVLSTGASAENIDLMLDDKIELSITMGDAVRQAYEGFGAYYEQEPKRDLRGIASLYPNFVQVLTLEDSEVKNFEDLEGKKVGVGAPGSGVELNARLVLGAHGMNYYNIEEKYLDYGEAIEYLRSGQIDAAFVTSGIPNPTVKDLIDSHDVLIIPIEGEGMENLKESYPFFTENVIPEGTYNNHDEITTATIKNLLLVNKNLSDDKVYNVTKSIVENIQYIQQSHESAEKYVTKENLTSNMVVPFHPGAKQYFKEKGLLEDE
ncbi:TAXI family TRAP transporter solute-binding subunit [Natranaerofaba carboxydovora]|uniref:TAXI family TRAP transporter solute-binding subunit n=1 Tax=Natranaerofaba carboxydovora TaxID=2742683 RepID=UPI001F129B48|nr:TAXI family TRAP transporter solute-binding subunit [Natranaerofaba carboxydovora]UMZ73700.1 NMT1-like family protein [Natranaerofaba carboxydovora]